MTSASPSADAIIGVNYATYLAGGAPLLLARYVAVEGDLARLKLEYAQVLCDEKRTRALAWLNSFHGGASATAADREAEHTAVHAVTECITLRAEIDVLDRESIVLLVLLREGALDADFV